MPDTPIGPRGTFEDALPSQSTDKSSHDAALLHSRLGRDCYAGAGTTTGLMLLRNFKHLKA